MKKVLKKVTALVLSAGIILSPAYNTMAMETGVVENTQNATLQDGIYTPTNFSFSGGSGKVTITCSQVEIKNGEAFATIKFSSTKYTNVKVSDTDYAPTSNTDGSIFVIPVNANGETAIVATTVAMSKTSDVEYTLTLAVDKSGRVETYTDGYYTKNVTIPMDLKNPKYSDGRVFSYPKNPYSFNVTTTIKDGKIVAVDYTDGVNVAASGSDRNYLIWAMDGHVVTNPGYYYIDPETPKTAEDVVETGIEEQVIAHNGVDGVDVVTGATITSKAIIEAVEDAVERAKTGDKDDPEPTIYAEPATPDVVPEDGVYTTFAEGDSLSIDYEPVVLKVEKGIMKADFVIQQRQSSYPYIYTGSEDDAIKAGETSWYYPEDFDYGYKNPGSLFKNVIITSLDKNLDFVNFASGSGNWFNRQIYFGSKYLRKVDDRVLKDGTYTPVDAEYITAPDFSEPEENTEDEVESKKDLVVTFGKVTAQNKVNTVELVLSSETDAKVAESIMVGDTVYTDQDDNALTATFNVPFTLNKWTRASYVENGKKVVDEGFNFVLDVHVHDYEKVVKKATLTKDGEIKYICSCGDVEKTEKIYAAKTVQLNKTSLVYTGRALKPSIVIKDSKKKTISKSNYTVTYKNNTNVGKAIVVVKGKNNYNFTKTLTFTINPSNTAISKITAEKKAFIVKWKAFNSKKASGYQIRYSTDKNMKKAKLATINKNTITSKKINAISKKKYYVQIRTYKTVNGKKYYSSWSKTKSVTTKK
ncbi:FMN-binding domain-containing protein [Acetitomaculum ruminis DSM 5522]|uniref:FMN-binding domain-containing protein n=1 Tax=Acetitomaculum ruminis DSM 5522 TaxID=1120918 RepID=A0A1I0WMR2_9FIRM|nr:FMN-binding protein [Acetitomaculum ruminis]SFA89236.1 FMN-binding domain-containing protein [Acetitomaculum ruminis DSM 5522]